MFSPQLRQFVLLFLVSFPVLNVLMAATARYRLSWREDPSSTMVIGFDQVSGGNAKVVYDLQDFGRNVNSYRFTATPTKTVNSHGMRNTFVYLRRLRPATTYYFLVVDSDGTSRRMSFETAPNAPNIPLSIIAGGDSRNNREVARRANRIVSKLRPHFVLFGGDMTNSDTGAEWRDWFDDWQLTISLDGRLTPIVAARGNHERSNQTIVNLFDVPSTGVAYALAFGGNLLRTYTLNSLDDAGGAQARWLASDLSRHQPTWKIAQYHHGMRPHTSSKRENDHLVFNWASLFTTYGVNLAIECDAHVVKQTYPIRPSQQAGSSQGFVRDDQRGTVYVGEGCWGAPLRANNDDKPWTRASGRFNQFKWIWVSKDELQIRTVMVDRSAAAQQEVVNTARFRTPPGIYYWDADNGGDVLRVAKRLVPASPPNVLSIAPPVAQSRDPENELVRDVNNRVNVNFTLPTTGKVEMLVIGPGNRMLWRGQLPVRGPGPYTESVQLPNNLPLGATMELVVKSSSGLLAKYVLR